MQSGASRPTALAGVTRVVRMHGGRLAGFGAGVTFVLVHGIHVVLAAAAPAAPGAIAAAVRFACHIP